jgi:hypothetical protein
MLFGIIEIVYIIGNATNIDSRIFEGIHKNFEPSVPRIFKQLKACEPLRREVIWASRIVVASDAGICSSTEKHYRL